MLWQSFQYWVLAHRAYSEGTAKPGLTARHRVYFVGSVRPPVHKAVGEPRSGAQVPLAVSLLGCPSTGGQRFVVLHQSASRHRFVGALSFGSPHTGVRRGKPRRLLGPNPAATAGAVAAWRLAISPVHSNGCSRGIEQTNLREEAPLASSTNSVGSHVAAAFAPSLCLTGRCTRTTMLRMVAGELWR